MTSISFCTPLLSKFKTTIFKSRFAVGRKHFKKKLTIWAINCEIFGQIIPKMTFQMFWNFMKEAQNIAKFRVIIGKLKRKFMKISKPYRPRRLFHGFVCNEISLTYLHILFLLHRNTFYFCFVFRSLTVYKKIFTSFHNILENIHRKFLFIFILFLLVVQT